MPALSTGKTQITLHLDINDIKICENLGGIFKHGICGIIEISEKDLKKISRETSKINYEKAIDYAIRFNREITIDRDTTVKLLTGKLSYME